MAPRKEILDSDEEDDDFSPVKALADPPRLEESNDHEHDSFGTPRTRRAESTDPSFFRNVYDEQHVAAIAPQSASSVTALSSEEVSTLSPNLPPTLGHTNGQHDRSHLSSITDPVPASRRRHQKLEMKEVVDLTQVTTPGRPTPSVPTDIWDFPASPDAGDVTTSSSVAHPASTKKKITIKLKKTETKRKRGLSSSIQSPDQISTKPGHASSGLLPAQSVSGTQVEQLSDVGLPGSRQKRRRMSSTGQQAPSSQEVDLVVIPKSEDKVTSDINYVTPTGNSTSIVEDSSKTRPISLLVVPSTTLTASQKDEYKFVSLSSEADQNHEPFSLLNPIGQTEDLHKSSGSATIKYPTPIEFASSGLGPGDYGTASSSRPKRRRNAVNHDPPSSPDIISAPAVTPREKGVSHELTREGNDTYAAPSSPPSRSTRRLLRGAAVPDELLSPASAFTDDDRSRSGRKTKALPRKHHEDDLAAPSSLAASKAENGTKALSADNLADPGPMEIVEQPTAAAVQEEPPQKKARGTKRKEAHSEAVVEERLQDTTGPQTEEDLVAVETRAAEGQETAAPKKRRGRPRKEPQSEAIVIEEDPDPVAPAPGRTAALPMDGEDEAPTQKKRRGRPRKYDAARTVDIEIVSNGGIGVVQQDEQDHNDSPDDRQHTAGKLSKKAAITGASDEDERAAALTERDSNSNLGSSFAIQATTARDAVDDTAKENKLAEVKAAKEIAKEESKAGPPSSQLGKIQYRVGLSKKSRIAPLLKSFRK